MTLPNWVFHLGIATRFCTGTLPVLGQRRPASSPASYALRLSRASGMAIENLAGDDVEKLASRRTRGGQCTRPRRAAKGSRRVGLSKRVPLTSMARSLQSRATHLGEPFVVGFLGLLVLFAGIHSSI